MNTFEIQEYLQNNKSIRKGKFRLHSCVKSKPLEYKFRYYYRDEGFREIFVYVTIDCSKDELEYEFSVELNKEEQKYLISESLERILVFMEHKSILHSHMYDLYIRNRNPYPLLETQDYRNILDYIQYQDGITQEGIDTFYFFFMPYLEHLIKNKEYEKFFGAFGLVLERANEQQSWIGANTKYLDTQYHYHKKHVFTIMEMIVDIFDDISSKYHQEVLLLLEQLFENQRFGLEIMVGFTMKNEMKQSLREFFKKYGMPNWDNENIAVRLLLESLKEIRIGYNNVLKDVLRFIMVDVTLYANHASQLHLGKSIIKKHGYELLIDIFKEDYNTFVFKCFPIETFPSRYRLLIKKELENAIEYYIEQAKLYDHYQIVVEEVMSIYRVLLENYRR